MGGQLSNMGEGMNRKTKCGSLCGGILALSHVGSRNEEYSDFMNNLVCMSGVLPPISDYMDYPH